MKNELFRMRIASKRQVTVPQRLLDVLGVSEGDEIQIETHGSDAVSVHGCKSVPTAMLSEKLRQKLANRADTAMEQQQKDHPSAKDVLKEAKTPKVRFA